MGASLRDVDIFRKNFEVFFLEIVKAILIKFLPSREDIFSYILLFFRKLLFIFSRKLQLKKKIVFLQITQKMSEIFQFCLAHR